MSTAVLRFLESQGYFDKARAGDHRACGLFARLAAYEMNPSGAPNSWGCLRKTGGGANVDGYSEDAIVFGSDQSNVRNVVDLIIGAGAPGARLVTSLDSFVSRRSADVWEKPVPLSAADMDYLKPGSGHVEPGNPPAPVPPATECRFVPTVGMSLLNEKIEQLAAMVDACNDDVRDIPQVMAGVLNEVALLRSDLADLIARMEQGFVVDANARIIGRIGGTVRLPKGE